MTRPFERRSRSVDELNDAESNRRNRGGRLRAFNNRLRTLTNRLVNRVLGRSDRGREAARQTGQEVLPSYDRASALAGLSPEELLTSDLEDAERQVELDLKAYNQAKVRQRDMEVRRNLGGSGLLPRDPDSGTKSHMARYRFDEAEARYMQSEQNLAALRKEAERRAAPPYERSGSSSQAQQGGPGPETRARIGQTEAAIRRKRSLDRQDPRGRDSDPRGRDSDEDRSDEDREDPWGRGGYGR
jgi:hypothetical protein